VSTGLSAAELLELADAGANSDVAQRGLLLLEAALGERSLEELAAVALGARDGLVFELRCDTFGDKIPARISCPACELLLSTEIAREEIGMRALPERDACSRSVPVSCGDVAVEARTPDGAALTRAACAPDLEAARRSLIESCIVSAVRGEDEPLDPLALPDAVICEVGDALLEADPQAEVRVDLTCAGCGHQWAPVFDPVLFLWRELTTTSQQILDDVHQLATGYGWSEEEVLRLSSRRRRRYVERLLSA
jgi:hypothetical protein